MNISEKISVLEEMIIQKEKLQIEKKVLLDKIITPEIKQLIEELDVEFGEKLDMVEHNMAKISSEIKQEVVQLGTSIKGNHLHIVYSKGRTSWDTKTLEALALLVPEIDKAKKVGEPSVSIKEI